MSDLALLIDWEKFRDQKSYPALERYLNVFFSNYSELLDLRALNYSACGPAFSQLPSDTVSVMFRTFQYTLTIITQPENETKIPRATMLIKFFCLLARNPSNLEELSYSEIIRHIYKMAEICIEKLSEENREQIMNWLDILTYTFYFLECLYDPKFSWRRWKKSIYTRDPLIREEVFKEPLSSSNDAIPWFCNYLRSLANDRDLRGRVMHLFCAAISGSKCNAQQLITPATIDAFQIEKDPTTEAIISYSLLVKCLSTISLVERQIELSIVVENLILALKAREKVNLSEATCVSRLVTLSDELTEIFVQCDIVDILRVCLVDQEESVCLTVTKTLISLTHGSCRERFRARKGYDVILSGLQSISAPAEFLPNHLISWVVGEEFDPSKSRSTPYKVRDGEVVALLVTWACSLEVMPPRPGVSPNREQGLVIITHLTKLAKESRANLTECSQSGLLPALVFCMENLCDSEGVLDDGRKATLINALLQLIEAVGSHSVSANDLIALIGLLRAPSVRSMGKRIMQILSNMAASNDRVQPAHWIELMGAEDGLIIVPGDTPAENFKLGARGFTLHTWICLDKLSVAERTENSRRQLFRYITASGNGLEAFFTLDNNLIVATCTSGDYTYTQVERTIGVSKFHSSGNRDPLTTGQWHMLDLVFAVPKGFALRSKPTISVYVDAFLIYTDDLKYPKVTDEPCLLHIGSCPRTIDTDIIEKVSVACVARRRTLSSRFLPSMSQTPESSRIFVGNEWLTWGNVTSLRGQMISVAGFNEPITELAIKTIFSKGLKNLMHMLTDDSLTSKLIFYYHAKAYSDGKCLNLAPSHFPEGGFSGDNCAKLNACLLKATGIPETINQIGGVSALFPILEQIDFMEEPMPSEFQQQQSIVSLATSQVSSPSEEDEFVVVPDRLTDCPLEKSSVAGFIVLLRNLLSNEANQDHLLQTKGIPTLGMLLQKIDPKYLDEQVVTSIRSMVEVVDNDLRLQIYKFVLLDWRIWSRCPYLIRLKHCEYVSELFRHSRTYFRDNYGVRFFLETIRTYHGPNTSDPFELDHCKQLRAYLYNMILYIVHKHMSIQDLEEMIRFIHSCPSNDLIRETVELLKQIFTKADAGDQATMLMYEKGYVESLYSLLLLPRLSTNTKEAIIDFIHFLIMSDRVQDRYKNRFLLENVGFAGLFTDQFSPSTFDLIYINKILDILRKAASKDLYGVVQFLTKLSLAPFSHRVAALRMLTSLFDRSVEAVAAVAQQESWQDVLSHLLIKSQRQPENNRSMSQGPSTPQHESFPRSSTLEYFGDTSTPVLPEDKFDNLDDDDEEEFNISESSDSNSVMTRDESDTNLPGMEDDVISASPPSSPSAKAGSVVASSPTSAGSTPSSPFLPTPARPSDVELSLGELSANQTPGSPEEEKLCEELCELVLRGLHKLMWKGMEGCDKVAWLARHEVFACLQTLNERYVLIRPLYYIQQRLIELMLESCIEDIKLSSTHNRPKHLGNAKEVVRLAIVTVTNGIVKDAENEVQLLKLCMELLCDVLTVWEDSTMQDMCVYGIQLLLAWSQDPDHIIYVPACERLHYFVTSIGKTSFNEVCWVITCLHTSIQTCPSENYLFLLPVMKTMLERHSDLLETKKFLPSLYQNLSEEFKVYLTGSEWIEFLANNVASSIEQFETKFINPVISSQSLLRAESHQTMLENRTHRNAKVRAYKNRFERDITIIGQQWPELENRKTRKWNAQQRNQHVASKRQWRSVRQSLAGPHSAWVNEEETIRHWKLSYKENRLRQRPKLEVNYNFNQYEEAARERDNPQSNYPNFNGGENGAQDNLQLMLGSISNTMDFAHLGDDRLGDEEWLLLQDTKETESHPANVVAGSDKNKKLFSVECDLITLVNSVHGRLELTATHLSFFDTTTKILASSHDPDEKKQDICCNVSDLQEIHFRRYTLRRSAIEIFLIDHTNYFFNFDRKTRNMVYSKILSLRPNNLIYSRSRSPADVLKASNLTEKWERWEISNFEYLMQLNTIAGRTYNDLSQYPVFPWILADYTSNELDLTNPDNFRDLSLPIGVVNRKHIKDLQEKFESFEDPSGFMAKFHFGTHYSNAAGVMHYMVRVEPFTQLHIQLQSGKFDCADRQFQSIATAWNFIMDNPQDNKELIPEFFYFSDFLRNDNKFDLGRLQQNNEPVEDVKLPPWAHNDPELFVHLHRKALESDHVSQHLHHWIDLIFGYKQKGPAAEEAINVFLAPTYEGAVDLDAITNEAERKATEDMIINFGQIPCQLLKDPHPRRMTAEELQNNQIKFGRTVSIYSHMDKLNNRSSQVSTPQDPIIFVSIPANQQRGFVLQDKTILMITVSQHGFIGQHNWLSTDPAGKMGYVFEQDLTIKTKDGRKRSFIGSIMPGLQPSYRIYATSSDAKYLYAGGQWDNSLTVYLLGRYRVECRVTRHTDLISCISMDTGGSAYMIVGSWDTTCSVWDLHDPAKPCQIQLLFGHRAPVTCVALCKGLDLAVSGSDDGVVNIHTVQRRQFMHSICLSESNQSVIVHHLALNEVGDIFIQWEERHTSRQHLTSYSINARQIAHQVLDKDSVTCMLLLSMNQMVLGTKAGKLIFRNTFDLEQMKLLNFNQSIKAVFMANGDGHLIISLSDGKLIFTTAKFSQHSNSISSQ